MFFGSDMSEKASLLFCLDKYLNPYFGYNLPYKDEIILLVKQVSVCKKSSQDCRDEAMQLLAMYE